MTWTPSPDDAKPCDGKVRYRSQERALRALANIQGCQPDPPEWRREQRVYECPHCLLWHLPSKPARPGQEIAS